MNYIYLHIGILFLKYGFGVKFKGTIKFLWTLYILLCKLAENVYEYVKVKHIFALKFFKKISIFFLANDF